MTGDLYFHQRSFLFPVKQMREALVNSYPAKTSVTYTLNVYSINYDFKCCCVTQQTQQNFATTDLKFFMLSCKFSIKCNKLSCFFPFLKPSTCYDSNVIQRPVWSKAQHQYSPGALSTKVRPARCTANRANQVPACCLEYELNSFKNTNYFRYQA